MRQIGIGMIGGGGFIGRVLSVALRAQRDYFWPLVAEARLVAIADIAEAAARDFAARFGYERWTADWRAVLADPAVEAVIIGLPNHLHREVSLAAIAAGKHVLCEKPLAMNPAEAREMTEAAERAGVVAMVGHNYRRLPGIQQARRILQEGRLGRIYHFRGVMLQAWGADPDMPLSWRFQAALAGSGVIGDFGVHLVDTARFLLGDLAEVVAHTEIMIPERPLAAGPASFEGALREQTQRAEEAAGAAARGRVETDDAAVFIGRFASGTLGSFEVSRVVHGRGNHLAFEINGSEGSLAYDEEQPHRLRLFLRSDPAADQGFRDVLINPAHPNALWPLPGMPVTYVETKVLEVRAFLEAIAQGRPAEPSFRDGWQVLEVIEAARRSAAERRWVAVPRVG